MLHENTLCGGHVVGAVGGGCLSDGHGEGLEGALTAVVVVLAPQTVHVQRDSAGLCEAFDEVRDHLTGEVANLFPLQAKLDHRVRPVREVHHGPGKSLVQGCEP